MGKREAKTGTVSVSILLLAASAAQAAFVWDGETDGNWNTATNWDTDVKPGNSHKATFNTAGAINFDTYLGAGRILNGLIFNENATNDIVIRLGLNPDGSTARNLNLYGYAEAPQISVDSNSTADVTFTGAGQVTLGLGTGTDGNLMIGHNGSGTLYFTRPITGEPWGITNSGPGTVVFSGNNTYTGDTVLQAGTLLVNGDQTDATGTIQVGAGAYLGGSGTVGGDIVFAGGAGIRFGGTLTANGSSVDLGTLGIAGVSGISSTVAAGTNTLIAGSATLDFSAVQNLGMENAVDIGNGRTAYFINDGGELGIVVEGGGTSGLVWLDFATDTNSVAGILPTTPVLGAAVTYGAQTNFYYDLGNLGIGGDATTLELMISSVNGSNLYLVGSFGLSVESGNLNVWQAGEDVEFMLRLLDVGANDVTSDYDVDLAGAEIRVVNINRIVSFNGESFGTGPDTGAYVVFDTLTGAIDETSVYASYDSPSGGAQLSGLRFNLVPKGVTTEVPAEIVAIRPVAGGLLELEISAPTPGLSCLKGKGDLVYGAWARVPHSDDGVNEFKLDALSYSTASGTNVLIYVEQDGAAGFFGTGPQ